MAHADRPNPVLLAALGFAGLLLPVPRLRDVSAGADAGPHAAPAAPAGRTGAGPRPGAAARAPHEIPARGWWAVLKRVGSGFSQDRVMAEAAGVTFYGLLALFPAIASLISIYGLITDPASLAGQLRGLVGIVPDGGLDIIRTQVSTLASSGHKALGFGVAIGLATSLWSANAGMKSLFDALNVVFHEREKRSFVRLTLTSLGFTLGAVAFLIIALLAVVALPIALAFVGLGSVTATLVAIGRWPLMLAVLAMALGLIYRYGPSRTPARWRWVSSGGAAAAVVWVLASAGFSYYVANFGSYNKTYGSLGAVIGFMTWIWISGMVILLGAELDAQLERQTDADTTVGPPRPRGSRGAWVADEGA